MIDFKISPGTAGNSDIPERFDDLPSHNIEVFQSENIQNILDAKSENFENVEVHYEIKKMDGRFRAKFKKSLGEKYFETLTKSFEESEAQDIGEQVEKINIALKNENSWYALIITEKNTTGLQGDETGEEKGSNYHALMRHTNKSEKKKISGGTFGKGSSVYTYSSGIWMWFAYSVLEENWKNTKKRFVGRGMIAPYIDHNAVQSYNGPVWYSRPENDRKAGEYKKQGLPYINEKADSEAEKFGISIRDNNHIGTTYLIPVFWPDGIEPNEMSGEHLFKKLKNEIIKRWYVPIFNEEIKCVIKYEEGDLLEELTRDNLYNIPELTYKLDILDWYYKGKDENDKRFKYANFTIPLPKLKKSQQEIIKKKYGEKIAHRNEKVSVDLVLRELDPEERDFEGFHDEDSIGTVNRVSLIRNKGMIVNHYPYDSRKQIFLQKLKEKRFEAILFAGSTSTLDQSTNLINHLELLLSYAENPAHNEWIHKKNDNYRCHLKRFEGERPSPAGIINMIFGNIDRLINQFFPVDDQPPVRKEICSFWNKLYKLPKNGKSKIRPKSTFKYETLNSGFDDDGKYFWNFLISSEAKSKDIELQFLTYLESLDKPIRKKEDLEAIGVPEFQDITITENGVQVERVVLPPNGEKDIIIKTCKILGNHKFKNLNPILEVLDTKNQEL